MIANLRMVYLKCFLYIIFEATNFQFNFSENLNALKKYIFYLFKKFKNN